MSTKNDPFQELEKIKAEEARLLAQRKQEDEERAAGKAKLLEGLTEEFAKKVGLIAEAYESIMAIDKDIWSNAKVLPLLKRLDLQSVSSAASKKDRVTTEDVIASILGLFGTDKEKELTKEQISTETKYDATKLAVVLPKMVKNGQLFDRTKDGALTKYYSLESKAPAPATAPATDAAATPAPAPATDAPATPDPKKNPDA